MDDTTKQLLYDARLIIDNHHSGFGASMVLDACSIRQRALRLVGIEGTQHTEDEWDENIGKLPAEIRSVMIELDDALELHRFC